MNLVVLMHKQNKSIAHYITIERNITCEFDWVFSFVEFGIEAFTMEHATLKAALSKVVKHEIKCGLTIDMILYYVKC